MICKQNINQFLNSGLFTFFTSRQILRINICGALRDLVSFVQFKKHPWFTKRNTPPWMFFTFFKLCRLYQIAQNITNIFNFYLSNSFNINIIAGGMISIKIILVT